MKKHSKKLGLIIIGLIFYQLAFSQVNFIEGYIINNKGEKLSGYVDYRNWGVNPSKVKFYRRIGGEVKSYKPNEIKEFGVHNEIYISGIIDIEISPRNTKDLNDRPEFLLTKDTAFLQTLVGGEKSLFYFKNSFGFENYYIKKENKFELLLYKKYLKFVDFKRVELENAKYKGQLSLYLNDCSSIQDKLLNVRINRKDLINLFLKYYKCIHAELVFQRTEKKIKLDYGLLAGVSSTSINFKSSQFFFLVDANFNSSTNFSAGLFLEFVLPKDFGKWSFNNELLFSDYKLNGYYEDFKNDDNYKKVSTEIGFSHLKLVNLLRYKYPVGSLHIYLNAGFANGITLKETNIKKTETNSYFSEDVIHGPAITEIRKYEQSLVCGTGLEYGKFSVELRFEIGNGMSKYATLKSTTKRYYLLLSYRL